MGPFIESNGWVAMLLAMNGGIAYTVAIAAGSGCGINGNIALGIQWLRGKRALTQPMNWCTLDSLHVCCRDGIPSHSFGTGVCRPS